MMNPNINYPGISRFLKSRYCGGSWCMYAQQCIGKGSPFRNDNYVNGICNLFITELNDVLFTNPFLNIKSSQVKYKKKLLSNKKSKLRKIQTRYVDYFIKYKYGNGSMKGEHRTKRDIANKLNLNGVPIGFFEDVIKHYDFSSTIFIFDKDQMFSKQNQKTNPMLATNALTKKLLRERKQFTFSFMEANALLNLLYGSCNNPIVRGLTRKASFFVVSDTNQTRKLLSEFALCRYMNSDVTWFAVQNRNSISYTDINFKEVDYLDDEYLSDAKIGIDSNFYMYKVSENDKSVVHIYERYRKDITENKATNKTSKVLLSPMVVNYLGIWREGFGIVSIGIPFWERRANLTGVQFACTTVEEPPYQVITTLTGGNRGQVKITGYLGDIWDTLQSITNFDYVMYPSVDGGYGSLKDDGTWSGQIGMILRDEVQFGISNFYVTLERSHVVDFSTALLQVSAKMLIRLPSQDVSWSTLVKPFSNWTWIVTLTMVFLSSLIISITYYINKRGSNVDVEHPNNFGLIMTLFMSLASLFQQGIEYEPRKNSTRIATITMLFTALVVYAAYSASLTSFLAIFKTSMPFSDLESMYIKTSYKIGGARFYGDLFKRGNELDKSIFKDRYEVVDSVNDGLQKAIDEEFAFIKNSEALDFLVGQKCSHIIVPNKIADFIIAFVIKKNSPYKNMFNYFLLKLEETGQLSQMWSTWKADPRKKCFGSDASSQGIFNVFTAFVVLGGAIVLSLTIMACEIIFKGGENKNNAGNTER